MDMESDTIMVFLTKKLFGENRSDVALKLNLIDPVMFGVHQGGKLLIQTRTKTKQSSSRLDKELSPMVDIKHDRVYLNIAYYVFILRCT